MEVLLDDPVHDRVDQGDVRRGVVADVLVGQTRRGRVARVADDDLLAGLLRLEDPACCERVRLDAVRADHEDDVGVLDILEGVRRGAGAEREREPRDGRSVADTRAVVDVVGLEGHPREFLHDVALFVRSPARDLEAEGVRPVLVADLRELRGDEIISLVPGSLDELAVLLDEGLCQTVGALDELPAGCSLGAEFALVDRAPLVGFDTHEFAIVHHKVESAPYAAVGAGCGNVT